MNPAPERSGSGPRSPGSARLIWICSLGTIFEWYDFFLYGAVAKLLSEQFFPAGNPVASLLLVLATFGAGFAVRPIGAFVFGSLGDRIGRKYTFVATMGLMGAATAAIGLLPTYHDIGLWASLLLVLCRVLQGLALGGEYGGAAIYVAEHAPAERRGLHTSWIQLSAAIGFLLALAVTVGTHQSFGDEAWRGWAWRIPFLLSILLLTVSLYWRLSLRESPVFQALKESHRVSRQPLRESLLQSQNLRLILIALFGVAAGQTVVWFTAQFSTLYLLQQQGGLDDGVSAGLMALATLIAAPAFVLSGWVSDRVGRRAVLITAYALALIMIVPLFHSLQRIANPQRAAAAQNAPVVLSGSGCRHDVFGSQPKAKGDCWRALATMRQHGIPYRVEDSAGTLRIFVGRQILRGFDANTLEQALRSAGYFNAPQLTFARTTSIVAIAVVLIALAGMAYGPNAAILVELFPARIRYTSLSIPYHIGTGYFGGFQPFLTQYIGAKTGNPLAGLAYPLGVLAVALVVCILFLPETKDRPIDR